MGKSKRRKFNFYAGSGTIAKSVKGPLVLRKYIWDLTQNITFNEVESINDEQRQKAHHFLCHVYNSTKALIRKKDEDIEYKDDGTIPIPIYCRRIDQVFGRRQLKIDVLKRHGLLDYTQPDKAKKRSRYYSLPKEIWTKAQKIEDDITRKAWNSLIKGDFKKYTTYNIINKAPIRKANNNTYSKNAEDIHATPLVREAMDSISPCVFNPKYVGIWVNGLERIYKEKKVTVDEALQTQNLSDDEKLDLKSELYSLEQKYKNERSSQRTILAQKPIVSATTGTKGEILYEYSAAYIPQRSGRLSEIGGGLQNASRIFKHRAFIHVKTAKNYDLKASQAAILIQELDVCHLDSSWLRKYIGDDNAKQTYADELGINTDTWKKCLYSTIMGSVPHLPKTAVINALRDHFELDKGQSKSRAHISAKQALKVFKDVAGDLIRVCNKWRDYIISPESHYLYDTRKGYRCWFNACGMHHKRYCLDRNDRLLLMTTVKKHKANPQKYALTPLKTRKTAAAKRSLAAFILQGQEACFIHELTLECKKHNIKILRNEHDGVISDKKIPAKLVSLAAQKSGLQRAGLDRKRIASKSELEVARNLIRKEKVL